MKKLRLGVVGVGHIGKNHARLYAELSGAQFTAIYDTDQATFEAWLKKTGKANRMGSRCCIHCGNRLR
jgi:predicted dehydrogenase